MSKGSQKKSFKQPLTQAKAYEAILRNLASRTGSRPIEEVNAFIDEINVCFVNNHFDEPFPHWVVRESASRPQFTPKEQKALMGIRMLVSLGLKLRFDHHKTDSLLAIVCKKNNLEFAAFLVEQFQIKLEQDEITLLFALDNLSDKLFLYLVRYFSFYAPSGVTLFTMAAQQGNDALMSRLFATGYQHIQASDDEGYTPLMYSVIHNHRHIFDILWEKSALPGLRNAMGQTVAHLICQSQSDIWAPDQLSDALHASIFSLMNSTSEFHRDNKGLLPIHYAVQSGRLDWIICILDRAPSLIHVVDVDGQTLVFHAMVSNQLSALKTLHQQYGLSLTARNNRNQALVNMCPDTGQVTLLDWLKEQQSIDFNSVDLPNPLSCAIVEKNITLIRWLLSQKELNLEINTDPHDEHGWSNLHALIDHRLFDVIIELDLFRANKTLMVRQHEKQLLCLDVYNVTQDCLQEEADLREKTKRFMHYVLAAIPDCLGSAYPILNAYRSAINMIYFCLDNFILSMDDRINDGEPVFHALEAEFYRKSQAWRIMFKQLENSFEGANLDSYPEDMRQLIENHKPDLNMRDHNGQHLFAKLIRLGPEGGNRIKYLCNHDFQITNLDVNKSTLLHLACEMQDLMMIKWCVEKKGLSATTKRLDGQCALDILLRAEYYDGAFFLFKQLTVKSRRNYLRGMVNLNLNELFEQLRQSHFFDWVPTPKEFKELPEKIQACFPHLFEQMQRDDTNIVVASTDLSALGEISSIEPAVNIEPAFYFDAIQLKKSILQNNVSWIKELKRACHQNETDALKLQTLMKDDVFEWICLSMREKSHGVLYQLLRIPVVQKLIEPHLKNFLPYVVKRGQTKALYLFLKQPNLNDILSEQAFELLLSALNERHLSVFSALLSDSIIQLKAHDQENKLLRLAAKQGQYEIIQCLLSIQSVRDNAAANQNEALKNAASIEDEDICLSLLHISGVAQALSADHYLIVREAIVAKQERLLHLMCQVPHVREFLKNSPEWGYVWASLQETNVQTINPFLCSPEIYFNEWQQMNRFCLTILNGDLYGLSHLVNQIQLNPSNIKELALFALLHCQAHVLYWLIESDVTNTIKSHAGFCNLLILQALSLGYDEHTLEYLLNLAPAGRHLALYENRLLMAAVRCKRPEIALKLLTHSEVCDLASNQNNYALRHAASMGYFMLVQRLLQIKSVQEYVGIIHHEAFRKAFKAGHEAVTLCLLEQAAVFEFAQAEKALYQAPVIAFVKQRLSHWLEQKVPLDDKKIAFLNTIKRIEYIYINPVIQVLLDSICGAQPVPALVTDALIQMSFYAKPSEQQNPETVVVYFAR